MRGKVICFGLIFLLAISLGSASILDFFKPKMTGNVVVDANVDSAIFVQTKTSIGFNFPTSSMSGPNYTLWLNDVDNVEVDKVWTYIKGDDRTEDSGVNVGYTNVGEEIYIGYGLDGDVAVMDSKEDALFRITPLTAECLEVSTSDSKVVCEPGEGSATFRIDSAGKIKSYVGKNTLFNFPDGDAVIFKPEYYKYNLYTTEISSDRTKVGFTLKDFNTKVWDGFCDVSLAGVSYYSNISVGGIEVKPVSIGTDSFGDYVIYDIKLGKVLLNSSRHGRIFEFGDKTYQLWFDSDSYKNGEEELMYIIGARDSTKLTSTGALSSIDDAYIFATLGVSSDTGKGFFITPTVDPEGTDGVIFEVSAEAITYYTGLIEDSCSSCNIDNYRDLCFTLYQHSKINRETVVECSNDWKAVNPGREANIDFLLEGYDRYKIDGDLSQLLFYIQGFNFDQVPVVSETCGVVSIDDCDDVFYFSGCMGSFATTKLEGLLVSDDDYATEYDTYNCINTWKESNSEDFDLELVEDFKACTDAYISGGINVTDWQELCVANFWLGKSITHYSCGSVSLVKCDEISSVISCMKNYEAGDDSELYRESAKCLSIFNEAHADEDYSEGSNLYLGETLFTCLDYSLNGEDDPDRGTFKDCVKHVNGFVNPECSIDDDCDLGYVCYLDSYTCEVSSYDGEGEVTHCGSIAIEDCNTQDSLVKCRNSYWDEDENAGLSELLACIAIFNRANSDGFVYACADQNYRDGLPSGSRVNDAAMGPAYCDLNGRLKHMTKDGDECVNDYECESNVCVEGDCYNLAEEIGSQTGVLKKILCFFSSGLSIENGKYDACIIEEN